MSSSENIQTPSCNCKENEAKTVSLLKDIEDLLQILREFKLDKERLEVELRERNSAGTSSRPVPTVDVDNKAKREIQSFLKIINCWKRNLQMRYDMLAGEKRVLEDEEKKLKERISVLERWRNPLETESEIKIARQTQERYPTQESERGF